jgi:hypothetical protein
MKKVKVLGWVLLVMFFVVVFVVLAQMKYHFLPFITAGEDKWLLGLVTGCGMGFAWGIYLHDLFFK